jgi:LacI family transcriptional regulator
MAATLKDIARLTGLSVPSVCLILNGQGHKFRAESREAVVATAKKLKYRPDMVMRRMGRASSRRDAVGLVIRAEAGSESMADQSVQEFLAGVNDYLLDRDQLVVVARVRDDDAGAKPPRIVAERFVDGLLLVESGLPHGLAELIQHYEILSVWLNTERREAHDCVYADDRYAGQTATHHLLKAGHRRIAFAGAHGADAMGVAVRRFAFDERQAGYRDAMTKAKNKPEVVAVKGDNSAAAIVKQIVSSRKTDAPITGVVTASLGMALGLIEALKAAGLRCPQDVSVVSSDDLHLFHSNVNVTRVSSDRRAIGVAATQMLLNKIEQSGAPQESRSFRGELIEGETTAPPKGD